MYFYFKKYQNQFTDDILMNSKSEFLQPAVPRVVAKRELPAGPELVEGGGSRGRGAGREAGRGAMRGRRRGGRGQ